jgi:hypothetical protein
MSLQAESPAVQFVRRHMEAYSDGDLDTARGNVAENVQADTNDVHLDGIEAYMAGLTQFAAILDAGSLRVLAAIGDEHKAIIMTEHTAGGQPLPSARTFELDEAGKIKAERVVFFGPAV